MALDLTGANIMPYYHTITGQNTTALEIKLPSACDQIEIENNDTTNDLYIGQNGQTDNTAWGANYFVIPPRQAKKVKIGRGRNRANSIFIAAAASTVDVHLEITEL